MYEVSCSNPLLHITVRVSTEILLSLCHRENLYAGSRRFDRTHKTCEGYRTAGISYVFVLLKLGMPHDISPIASPTGHNHTARIAYPPVTTDRDRRRTVSTRWHEHTTKFLPRHCLYNQRASWLRYSSDRRDIYVSGLGSCFTICDEHY